MESKNDTKNETEDIKPPKEMKYYYRHREEILEKKRQKRLEDPEYQAKYEERQRKKAEREELERKRKEKREQTKKIVEQILNLSVPTGGE